MDRRSRLPVAKTNTRSRSVSQGRSSRLNTPLTHSASSQNQQRTRTPNTASKSAGSIDIPKEVLRVKSFLKKKNRNIIVKPLSISIFIEITNILVQELGLDMQLSSQNYKDLLMEILRIIKYPYSIPPSVLVSPNSANAFPKILHVWCFMMDRIMLCSDEQLGDLNYGSNIILKTELFYEIEICNAESRNENIDDVLNKFEQKICKNYGYDEEEHQLLLKRKQEKEKELARYKQELYNAQLEEKELTTECNKIKSQLEIIEDENGVLKKFKIQLLNMLPTVEGHLAIDQDEMTSLKAAIEKSGHNNTSISELMQQIEQHELAVRESAERQRKNEEHISNIDLKLAETLKQIQHTIFQANKQVNEISRKFKNGAELLLPETRFATMDFLKEFEMLLTYKSDIAKDLKGLEDAKQTKKSVVAVLEKELLDIESKCDEFERAMEELKASKKSVHENEERVIKLRSLIKKLKNEKECLVSLHKTYTERVKTLTEEKQKETQKCTFYLNSANIICLKHIFNTKNLFTKALVDYHEVIQKKLEMADKDNVKLKEINLKLLNLQSQVQTALENESAVDSPVDGVQ